MNICEYRVKNSFFDKFERFRDDNDLGILEAFKMIGVKRSWYYKSKKTKQTSKRIVRRIMVCCSGRKLFSSQDFEKIC